MAILVAYAFVHEWYFHRRLQYKIVKPPRPPWIFPLRVSTLIVMTAVAGTLLMANLRARGNFENYDSPIEEFGWPNTAETRHENGSLSTSAHAWLLNVVIAVFTIAVCGAVSEWWTREPQQRAKLFQVHLSTAFFAMCLASVLLGLNIMTRGWPIEIPFYGSGSQALLLNGLMNLELVFFMSAVLEMLIRRKKARAQ